MSIRRVSFAPSRKPYAFDWSTYRVERTPIVRADGSTAIYRRAHVDAVWVGRKNGTTTVSWGEVGLGANFGSEAEADESIETFMSNFDPRYGGTATARWNGHDLWAPGFTPADVAETSVLLDAVLLSLPQVPDGFDGWYALK